MEKAIYITSLRGLKFFQKDEYQRIYWGAEFCQNLIPELKDTEKILSFIKKHDLNFTFVTPFVTERGLKRLNRIFIWLKKRRVACEVAVNDWGVLECLHSKFGGYFEIALGRLLLRQHRVPSIKSVPEKRLPLTFRRDDGKVCKIVHEPPGELYQKGIKKSYINLPLVQDFLSEFGVKRVELNNLMQGLTLKGIRFKKSLYTPYVNISTTRFCPMESGFQKIYRINACRKECQKHYDILHNILIAKVIYKRGNTTFYNNPLDLKRLTETDVDRMVFQPEIPF